MTIQETEHAGGRIRADMATPAEILDRLLPNWQASLPRRYAPEQVDSFLQRYRDKLEAAVADALVRRRAERGEIPETADEFAAFDQIVARERVRDAEPDSAVIRRVLARIDEEAAGGRTERVVFTRDYVDARAEAILLRHAGWDAVPLLVTNPALAIIVEGTVVGLRDTMGRLAIHPARRGTLNHLYFAMTKAETAVVHLREVVGIDHDSGERLADFALELWERTRASLPTLPRSTVGSRRRS